MDVEEDMVSGGGAKDKGVETELLREWEREWREGLEAMVASEGDGGLPSLNEFICRARVR